MSACQTSADSYECLCVKHGSQKNSGECLTFTFRGNSYIFECLLSLRLASISPGTTSSLSRQRTNKSLCTAMLELLFPYLCQNFKISRVVCISLCRHLQLCRTFNRRITNYWLLRGFSIVFDPMQEVARSEGISFRRSSERTTPEDSPPPKQASVWINARRAESPARQAAVSRVRANLTH